MTTKDYFYCWLRKSALLDYQDNSHALFFLLLSLPLYIVQSGLWKLLAIVLVWLVYHTYFALGRSVYLSSLQELYGQEQNITLKFK